MFARRQSALAAAAGAPPPAREPRFTPRAILNVLKKPPVAVACAGLLFLGAGAAFVAVLGDPRAGIPSARAGVDRPDAPERPALTGAEVFGVDTLGVYQDLTAPGDADATGGEAIITLPGGGQVLSGPVVRQAPADPLAPAPIAGLSQPGPSGPLPVIATDGRPSPTKGRAWL